MVAPRQNIEAKYSGVELARVRERAGILGARPAGILEQRDTFFPAPAARLKLRELVGGVAELISYRRTDRAEARASEYCICETHDPTALRRLLAHALGEGPTVTKRRELWLFEQTRIHLDEVEDLGAFVELETVVTDQPVAAAHRELAEVAEAPGLDAGRGEARPYVELLAAKG